MMIRSALHGFVEETLGLAWLILGIIFAFQFYNDLAAFLRTKIMHDVKVLPEVMAFIALFFLVFLIVKMVTLLLKDIITKIRLGGLDRFLGAVFGILEGLACISIIIFIINVQPVFDKDKILKDSLFNKILAPNIETAREIIVKMPNIPSPAAEMLNTEK
jgi:membrane protein required for colicin V production